VAQASCYSCHVAQPTLPIDPAKERAERAARVASMLDRWAAEDMSGEPDWEVEDFKRLDLTRSLSQKDPSASSKP